MKTTSGRIEMIWEDRGLLRKFRGVVTDADLKHSLNAIVGSRRFDGLRYILNDFTDATPDRGIDHIAMMLEAGLLSGIARMNPYIKVASVAVDEKVLKLIREFATVPVSPKLPHRIFATVEEARQWAEEPAEAVSSV